MRRNNSNPVQRALYLLIFMINEYYAWGEIGEYVPPMRQHEAANVLRCSVPTASKAISVLVDWGFCEVETIKGVHNYKITAKGLEWYFSHEDYAKQMARLHGITMKPDRLEVEQMQGALFNE